MGEDRDLPTEETGLLVGKSTGAVARDDDGEEEEEDSSIQKDIHDTISLAMPIFLAMLSWVGVRAIYLFGMNCVHYKVFVLTYLCDPRR